MALFGKLLVAVIGGGDLASGVIYRLHRAGFPLVVTELAKPLLVRRKVCYGAAVFEGQVTIESITACLVDCADDVHPEIAGGKIPVLIDEEGASLAALRPTIIVDARMAKRNLGSTISDATTGNWLGTGIHRRDRCACCD